MMTRTAKVMARCLALVMGLVMGLVLACGPMPTFAQTRPITFTGTSTEFPNPERGWWVYSGGKFQDFTDARAAKLAKDGYRVVHGIVRLDDYRNGPIPPSVLTSLDKSFEYARKNGLKVIVRFAYNFPTEDSASGNDAPLNTVLGHIRQIGPIITSNADTIVAMQAGFIGKWGELHSSSNGLATPENKKLVRDALYAAIPKTVQLQWRYPADIISWTGDTRMGFHNDCFLSSEGDVGTYSNRDAKVRAAQRAAMAELTARTFFSGETCSANLAEARLGCSDILAEGAQFHVASLNRAYFTGFHDSWKAGGCFEKVSRKLGYNLKLVDVLFDRRGSVTLRMKNSGWASPIQARRVVVTTFLRGVETSRFRLKGRLSSVAPDKSWTFTGGNPAIAKADRICFSAPDMSKRLAGNPAYSVRFANADAASQSWDAKLGAFCVAIVRRR
jgi:hypothetical protein